VSATPGDAAVTARRGALLERTDIDPITLDKALMPVPDGDGVVFDREWPLRVADIDRDGRLRLDAVARHILDVGQDEVHELGFDESHPLWIVRRTMVDVIRPIEFQDMLRLRRWCSGTSSRWCEIRVRIDGRKGGLIESEAFWININRDTRTPSRISDDFLERLQRTTDIDRLRWKPYLKPGNREDADQIREYPVRFTDIDLFDHVNNSVFWSVVEEYLSTSPQLLKNPLRVTIEHNAPIALGNKLEIVAQTYPAGATDKFGLGLAGRDVTTLTYCVGNEPKAVASIFAL
jgi:acyl-ACP thioesterase